MVKKREQPMREIVKSKRRGVQPIVDRLFDDISGLIEQARDRTASAVNTELTMLYWHIGSRIRQDVLAEKRAEYGKKIVYSLSIQLTERFGKGFSDRALFQMVRFSEAFPKQEIVYALSRQLSWTHLRQLIYIEDPLRREFYTELCRHERWSVRVFQDKIEGMLYERTGISRKPAELARKELAALQKEDRMTPDLVFRDPYFLDFLGLQDTFSEKDLESAILRSLEQFIIEFGKDFAFVARQKRITIDSDDYYIDLLFYHRGMQRLVAIDLKLGKFRAADKGQMELYLRWLDKYERRRGERSPLGLILCAGTSNEHVELLQLQKTGMRVAEYFTELPPKKLLIKKLQEAIHTARERLARRQLPEKTTP